MRAGFLRDRRLHRAAPLLVLLLAAAASAENLRVTAAATSLRAQPTSDAEILAPLEKGSEVVVECEYCGGHTPVKADGLMLWKKEEVLTFPSSVLSFVKKIARPLDSDDRMRAILKYLHLYRWFLIALSAILVALAMFALRGLLWPS